MNRDSRTLSELVAADSSRAKVLDELGLDYCCHGTETLDHACAQAGIDPDAVIVVLTETDAKTVPDDHNCSAMSPAALVTHLLDAHHSYLHRELPDLDQLAAKVLQVHGERHPELAQVRSLMTEIVDDLEPHMLKEERVLFPSILRLLEGQRQFPFGSIRNPIAMMSIEH